MLELAWRQEFYALGQDVLSQSGNLLARYGFRKYPRGADGREGAEYVWKGIADCGKLVPHNVHLWAFGVYSELEGLGGIFYSRASLRPWLVESSLKAFPQSHDDWMSCLAKGTRSRLNFRPKDGEAIALRQQLFAWFARYERWVLSEIGHDYRDASVGSWRQSVMAGRDLADLWRLTSLSFGPDGQDG